MIDSALDKCATTFSSITFVDDEVMRIPGKNWEYAIRTKFPESLNKPAVISDPVTFKTPWLSAFDGMVEVGTTGEPVAQVRVCGQLLRKRSEKFSTADFYGISQEKRMLVLICTRGTPIK